MDLLLSVIIPVYNLEKHLKNCITSILNLNLEHIELIIVNDGSTDNSGLIAQEFANNNKLIKLIHKENGGVSSARNLGVTKANGKWIYFLDGDDIINVNAFDGLFDLLKNEQVFQMILGNFTWGRINDSNVKYSNNQIGIFEGENIVLDYGLWKQKILMGAFLVSRNVLLKNNIKFNLQSKYGEDVEFIYYCLLFSNKIICVKNYFFKYVWHDESAISKVDFNRFDNFFSKKRVLEFISSNFLNHLKQKDMFTGFILPESIINSIELLINKNISIKKIKTFLKNNDLFDFIDKRNYNSYTPFILKKKIFLFRYVSVYFWYKNYYNKKYYKFRVKLSGILKLLFSKF